MERNATREQLKRSIGRQAALALILLPGMCALPLLALLAPPGVRPVALALWAALALALAIVIGRAVARLRRAERDAADEPGE